MAYHGGSLEEITDVIATAAAERAGASYYGVHQPPTCSGTSPRSSIDPAASPALAAFLDHVDHVVTVHGYGREGFGPPCCSAAGTVPLAEHVGAAPRRGCPPTRWSPTSRRSRWSCAACTPATRSTWPAGGGVQLELPPRVRGTSPLCWDWEGPGLNPHTEALVDGAGATSWPVRGPG